MPLAETSGVELLMRQQSAGRMLMLTCQIVVLPNRWYGQQPVTELKHLVMSRGGGTVTRRKGGEHGNEHGTVALDKVGLGLADDISVLLHGKVWVR